MSSSPLGGLFGRSPIRPLQEHMQASNEAAQHLPELVQASNDLDRARAREIRAAINEARDDAKKLKLSVRKHLPGSLFLPVPRSDLLELLAVQDLVAELALRFANVVVEREMHFPDSLNDPFLEYTSSCARTTQQALTAIQELDELLEVGFSGKEVKRVEAMLRELDKLEQRSSKQLLKLQRCLFKLESSLSPVDVMFYYRALELLSDLADAGDKVGERLQILLAK